MLGGLAMALKRDRLDEARRLISEKVKTGDVAAAVLHVQNGGEIIAEPFGSARTSDAVFLLASITKPMTVTAVMILADRGQLTLSDPVQKFIPEFKGEGRERVIIRHLLTHTSGLPDMLPENDELRKRHAPLKDFVAATCRTPLLFAPGTKVQYQSMGVLLAGEIVERITRAPLPQFLQREVFGPLGMKRTTLGPGGRKIADTMPSQVDEHTDWDWNSVYWRGLASPWGGALGTASDISRFLHYFVKPEPAILKAATAASMITPQTPGLGDSYGFGWRVGGARTAKGCSARTFGHSGSTGTLSWFDPERDLSLVLLTTRPAAVSQKMLLQPVSEAIASAI